MREGEFVSPSSGWIGHVQGMFANCSAARRLRRVLASRLPFLTLASDVTDVIYASWVIPTGRLSGIIPHGIHLIERDGSTIFTTLSYRHGHFGPAFLGPLRRLFPSPLQSNWRLYIDHVSSGVPERTVLFVRNVFDSALYALGTRIFSDSLPSHLARTFLLSSNQAGDQLEISGPGSAPTIGLTTKETPVGELPSAFQPFFSSWDEAVTFICLQDAAIATLPDEDDLAFAQIDLPIEVATILAREATSFEAGSFLRQIGAVSPPFCFTVPAVPFRVLSERLIGSR
ncbi:MAG: hypothetical protein DI623_06475 [Sphingomonas sanxanigenens]|jgi:uncharacterized protein YqjF (DUF2071 family)|uniref:DUF2071 domain-containing protein n=1 Tax=Sphingomonas sanxanigenens TaxID=397260 RepID=A0A2W5ADY5_9SPHN|nr:MAG: hypothetical protein DI623_06475 [Sphingomonas sanxanigenens]